MPTSQLQGVTIPAFHLLEKVIHVGEKALIRVEIDILGGKAKFSTDGVDLAFSYFALELRASDKLLYTAKTRYSSASWGTHNSLSIPLEDYLETLRQGANSIQIRRISEEEAGKR